MNRKQFREEISETLEKYDIDHLLNRWLNRALVKVVRDASNIHNVVFTELQSTVTVSTVAGTGSYALPSDARGVYNARVTDSGKSFDLIYHSPEEFDVLVPDPANRVQGTPILYTGWERKIELYPVPDGVYSVVVRYNKYPSGFSDDTTDVEISNMDDVVLACTLMFASEQLGDASGATYWRDVYYKRLSMAAIADVSVATPQGEGEGGSNEEKRNASL